MSAKNRLLATGCVVVSAAALALTDTGQALAQSAVKTVIATIDQSNPGVTNGVYVNNTPTVGISPSANSVSATISGTPNVNATLAAGSTVAVASSQTFSPTSTFAGASKGAVVTINAYEGRQPFFAVISTTQAGPNGANGGVTVSAPGKRLVIEYVSATLNLTSGVPIVIAVFQAVGSGLTPTAHGNANLALTKLSSLGTADIYVANQNLRLYAEDGDLLFGQILTAGPATITGSISVHGYFIDAP